MEKLEKSYYNIIDNIRKENFLGKYCDDNFLKRQLTTIPLPAGLEITDALSDLESQNILLRFQYVDEMLYILNEPISMQRVQDNALEAEQRSTESLPATTKDPIQKQRHILKNTVIKQIRQSIRGKQESAKNLVEKNAVIIYQVYFQFVTRILRRLNDSTEKYLNDFKHGRLYNLTRIEREIKFSDLRDNESLPLILTALLLLGEAQSLDYEGETYYYRFKDLTAAIGTLKKANPPAAEVDFFTKLTQGIEGASGWKEELLSADAPIMASSNISFSEEVSPEIIDKRAEEMARSAEVERELESLDSNQLMTELLNCIHHESSKRLLQEYFNEIEKTTEKENKELYFKTVFDCISMMIRVPSDKNERIYLIGKSLIQRILQDGIDEQIRIQIVENIENSYESFSLYRQQNAFLTSRLLK